VSAANVELVRSLYESWQRGDFSSSDWADPEIEFVNVDGPNPGRATGLVGMAEGWREFLGAWEGFGIEADEYRALDDTRVLALVRPTGRGKTSGLDLGHVRSKAAALFEFRGGKVRRLVYYWIRDRALVELGLAPEPSAHES
jgi:ketosteroid isomerase-like protein